MSPKSLFIIFICIIGSSFCISECMTRSEDWKEKEYYLPEAMQVTGSASGYLPSEQVIIELSIESTTDSAVTSLETNNRAIAEAIKQLKSLSIEEKEINTSGLQIFPSYKQVYNQIHQSYDQLFEGYKAINEFRIITNKLHLAGEIIDAAVGSGINNVRSVKFAPTSANIKSLKNSLITQAVEDAKSQAKLALDPLDYTIISVKSVNLENSSPHSFGRNSARSMTFSGIESSYAMDEGSGSGTQLYSSNEKLSVSVNVTFIIGKK